MRYSAAARSNCLTGGDRPQAVLRTTASTELEFAADAREPASVGAPRAKTPPFLWLREIAGNDAFYAREASTGEEGDAWARHAHGANGFGDAAAIDAMGAAAIAATRIATIDATPFAPPDSYDLYHAARRERSIVIGEAIAGAIVAVGATVRETCTWRFSQSDG